MNTAQPFPLADVIKAFHKLAPADDVTRETILRMLGWHSREIAMPPIQKPELPEIHELYLASTTDVPPISSHSVPEVVLIKQPSIQRGLSSRLEPPGKRAVSLPLQLDDDLPPLETQQPVVPYSLDTLFSPSWTRVLLSSALSTYSDEGPLLLEEALEKIARFEPIHEVPRQPWPTMSRGVQVLVDIGEAMEPFYQDQLQLQREISRVVGMDRTQTQAFSDCPLLGVRTPLTGDWSNYHPLPSGTPVAVLTDLGIASHPGIIRHSGENDWLRFAKLLGRAGCPLIAFVPYPSARWPQVLGKNIRIVQWDRTTSVLTIQRLIGRALRVSS